MNKLLKLFIVLLLSFTSVSILAKPNLPFVGTKYFQMHVYPDCNKQNCYSYSEIKIQKSGMTTISEYYVSGKKFVLYKGPYRFAMYNKNYGLSFHVDNDENIYLIDSDNTLSTECYNDSDAPSSNTACQWELGDD